MSTNKIKWVIEVRPANEKDGEIAFPAFDLTSFLEIDHPETLSGTLDDVLQLHLDDLDDADLINLRKVDGTYFYPEFEVASEHRRRTRKTAEPQVRQRDFMRHLHVQHAGNKDAVCAAYATADASGKVPRRSNSHNLLSGTYAEALWRDGNRKGWLA